jgi:competence protein ComEA
MRPEPTFTLIVTATPPPGPTEGPAPSARPNPAPYTWTRPAQLAAFVLIGLAAAFLAARALGVWPAAARPTDLNAGLALTQRIDLNRAGRAELMQLPGVGPALADAILAHRSQHGPFRSADDLAGVSGVGPRTLEHLRPWVETGPAVVTAALPAEPGPSTTWEKKSPPTEPLDPNRASLGELQRLPGIGPTLAQRIVAERSGEPFRAAEDLRRVRGIGPKTLEKIRPYLTFADRSP